MVAIDEMIRNEDHIAFDAVAKKARVARSTLCCNPEVSERIKSIRIKTKGKKQNKREINFESDGSNALRLQVIELQTKNRELNKRNTELLIQKHKLISQLVYFEDIKEEHMRLKKRVNCKNDISYNGAGHKY